MTGWPFVVWGIDIVGPMPEASKQRKFIIVAVDHFTKWIEAEAVSTITPERMIDFVQNHIITRFGIPKKIVSDNGTQFASKKFVEYCNRLKIENGFTSVAHPQANGQTEVMNRTIVLGLKKRLLEKKGNWPDELINVLWAHRTTPCRSTGETPFSLVYGVEAVILIDIGAPSSRIQFYSEKDNNINLMSRPDLTAWPHRPTRVFPVSFVLTRSLPGNNFPGGHSSQDCSKLSTFNFGVLSERAPKKKVHLVGIGSTNQIS